MAGRMLRYLGNNALGALALFVALGGVGYAATGGFVSGGQLRACVNEGGSLTLLKSGKRCKKGQKTIAWDQTGPHGPVGPKGLTGTNGAAGVQGATGATGATGASAAESILWARVSATGELESDHGVVAVHPGPLYEVTFNRDVSKCAILATETEFRGRTVTTFPSGARVDVAIDDIQGGSGAQDSAFTVAAIC